MTTLTKDAKKPLAAASEPARESSPPLDPNGSRDEEAIDLLDEEEAELVLEAPEAAEEAADALSAAADAPPPSRAEASTIIESAESAPESTPGSGSAMESAMGSGPDGVPAGPSEASQPAAVQSAAVQPAAVPAAPSGALQPTADPATLGGEASAAPGRPDVLASPDEGEAPASSVQPESGSERRAAHFVARLESARELLKACEAELASSPEPARAARLHYEAARILEVPLWDFASAAEHYEAARAAWPDHIPTLRGLRRVHMALGNYSVLPGLLDAELRGAQSAGRRGALLYEKGCLYRDYLDDPRQARSAFAAAVELDGSDLAWLRALELAEQSERTFAGLARVYELSASALAGAPSQRAAVLAQRARVTAYRAQDLTLATALYEAALKADERVPRALGQLKHLLRAQKRYNELVDVLHRDARHKKAPASQAHLLFEAARIRAERLADLDGSLADLERVQAVDPGDPLVLQELARQYELRGSYDKLVKVLRTQLKSARHASESLQLHARLGSLYAEQLDDRDAAVEHHRAALAIEPNFAPSLHALDRLYREAESWKPLCEIYLAQADAAAESQHRADALLRVADISLRHLGDDAAAIGHYQAALSADPQSLPAFKALVRLYRKGKSFGRLEELYQREVERAGDLETKRTFLFKLGRLQEDDLDAPEAAIDAYKRILELEPRNHEALHAIQRTAERAELWPQVVEALESEAGLTRDSVQQLGLWHRIGGVLETEIGDTAAAQYWYRKVLARDEGHLPTLRSLGGLYEGMGRLEDLVWTYKLELKVLPNPAAKAALLYKLGQLCEQTDTNDSEALAHYRKAVQLDPEHEPAMAALQRLLTVHEEWKELTRLLQMRASTLEDPHARARLTFRVGEIYEHHLNANDLALTAYDEALGVSPGFEPALTGRLRLLQVSSEHRRLADEFAHRAKRATDDFSRVDALLGQAEVLSEDLKSPAEAARIYESVLDVDPAQPAALFALARIYAELGNHSDLARVYGQQAEGFGDVPSRVAALGLLGQLAESRRLVEGPDVKQTFLAMVSLKPEDEAALATLERLGIAQHDWQLVTEVDAQLADCTRDTSLVAVFHTRLGEAQEGSDDVAALASYRQALAQDAGNVAATYGLSRIAERSGDAELLCEAAEFEARVARRPERAAGLLTLAASKRPQGVEVKDLLRALSVCPDHTEAATGLIQALTATGQFEGLLRALTQAAQSARIAERRSDLWIEIAKVQIQESRDSGAAIASAQRAVRERPDYPRAVLTLANLYSGAHQWREAVRWLREALKHDPAPALAGWAKLELARILADKLGSPGAAIEVLEPLTGDAAHQHAALSQLVHAEAAAGAIDRAGQAAAKLVSISETDEQRATALLQVAGLHQQRGDRMAALETYQQVVRLVGLAGTAATSFKSALREADHDTASAPWNMYAQALAEYLARQPIGVAGLADIHLELARTFDTRMGETNKALAVLKQGIAAVEDNAPLRLEMAQRLRRAGHPQQAVGEYLLLLGEEPLQPAYWRELSACYKEQSLEEQSRMALGPLMGLGAGTELEQASYEMRPALPEAARADTFDAVAMRALDAHPADDAPTTELLAALAGSAHKLVPVQLEVYGVTAKDKHGMRSSHPMRALADRVAMVLGVEGFDVYVHRSVHKRVDLELAETPALMIPTGIGQLPESMQVFLIARALSALFRKTYVAEKLAMNPLRQLLAACAYTADPEYRLDGLSSAELGQESKRVLKALPWRGKKAFEDAARAYAKAGQSALVDWRSRERVTAGRLATLLSDDVSGVVGLMLDTDLDLSTMAGERTAEAEMAAVLTFAVSDTAMQLRRRLGLALG